MQFSKAIPLSIRGGHPLPGAARHETLEHEQASSSQVDAGANRGPPSLGHPPFNHTPTVVLGQPTAPVTAMGMTGTSVFGDKLETDEADRFGVSTEPLYCRAATDRTGRPGYYFTIRFNEWTESTAAEVEKRRVAAARDGNNHVEGGGNIQDTAVAIQPDAMLAPSEGAVQGAGNGDNKPPLAACSGMKRSAAHMDQDDEDTTLLSSKPSRIVRRVKRVKHAFDHASHTLFRRASHDKRSEETGSEVQLGKNHADTGRASSGLLEGTRSVLSRLSLRQHGHHLPTEHMTLRKIKVCMIGAPRAGKTTLINRLITGQFQPATQSFATDLRIVPIPAAEQQNVGLMELWDIPGSPCTNISQQLMSNWFHVAIICFSIEDERNVMPVIDDWYPTLRASLIDCPVFVLGLKQDTRPMFHPLELPFLPQKEAAQLSMGIKAANKTKAAGYMECSAMTGENVVGCFQEMYSSVLKQMEGREKDRARGLRRGRAKELAKDAGRRISEALH